jgi:hypothetical protein
MVALGGIMMRLGLVAIVCLAACGNITRKQDDAGVRDDTRIDTMMMVDAGIDAPPALPPTESREIVNGAGRLTGATFTLDVQIGHGISQERASGATFTIEGNAAVKP